MKKTTIALFICTLIGCFSASARTPRGPHVILTFDDATASHREVVAPLLQEYGFGGTFFVCEFKGFENKQHYMSWEQIAELSKMGFEIGNHTRSHPGISRLNKEQLTEQIQYIENKCAEYGIPHPISFAYPGYDTCSMGIALLKERGYRFARHGQDRPYLAKQDDKMMLPSYAIHTKGNRTVSYVKSTLDSCPPHGVIILCLHGVPDLAHDFVSTPPEDFRQILDLLKERRCKVTALKDL